MIILLPRHPVLPLVALTQLAQAISAKGEMVHLGLPCSFPSPRSFTDRSDQLSRTNVGAIVGMCSSSLIHTKFRPIFSAGGVVGGVAGLLIIAFLVFLWLRRRRARRASKERPALFIDHDDEAPSSQPPQGELPVYYEPEPFTASEPTDRASTYRPGTPHDGSERPTSQSLTYLSDPQRVASPDGTSTGISRKSPIPSPLRPINVIQHEDAGPSLPADNLEPETVELPPAYTNIRKTPD